MDRAGVVGGVLAGVRLVDGSGVQVNPSRRCDACGRVAENNAKADCWSCVTRLEGHCTEAGPLISPLVRCGTQKLMWVQLSIMGHGSIRHACCGSCAVLVLSAMRKDFDRSHP